MMLTLKDIRTGSTLSGYQNVQGNPSSKQAKPFQAVDARRQPNGKFTWFGPRRATADEAAQDYCDHMNGNTAPPTPRLKSAGHVAPVRRQLNDGLNNIEREVLSKLQAKQREGIAKARKNERGYIYLIGEQKKGGSGAVNGLMFLNGHFFDSFAVKIGYSDESPERRIKQLQTGNPRPLVLLGHIRGTLKDEAKLHQQFIHHNVLQEWFRPTPALLSIFRKKEGQNG